MGCMKSRSSCPPPDSSGSDINGRKTGTARL
jgi:hypothetical protein